MARKRIDPTSRPADGYRPHDKLKNKDPQYDYVFVNPNDEMTGVGAYQDAGWECEHHGPDSVKVATGRTVKDGDLVTSLGQVVMKRLRPLGLEEFAAGQAEADAFDRRVTRGGNFEGPTRARGVAVGVDRATTSEPFEELEREGA